ncbi:MAG: biopolymer transporter ExbD [Planctomycetota bacterium]|nr:MAG: biopolymer transporter ExbD [Planctomycetota bacterium]
MRLAKRIAEAVGPDMTPMIDMTFQLIAFFMFTINFSDTEQDQRVTLPASELAKPPDAPYEHPLTIHLTEDGEFIYASDVYRSLDELRSALLREKQIIERFALEKLSNVTIVIRADENARTGQVQEIIQLCQELKFERFALRGKQAEVHRIRSD